MLELITNKLAEGLPQFPSSAFCILGRRYSRYQTVQVWVLPKADPEIRIWSEAM